MTTVQKLIRALTKARSAVQNQMDQDAVYRFSKVVHDLGYQDYTELKIAKVNHSGLIQEAVKYCKQFLIENPSDTISLNTIGVLLTNNGKASEARQYFEKALKQTPKDRNIHENLMIADIYMHKSRPAWHKIPRGLKGSAGTFVAHFDPHAM